MTFTAPSFGRVHTNKAQGRLVLPRHPYRQGARCSHGNRAGSWHRHSEDDPRLGEPLCPSCYDAQAQVLWNALAPGLWQRTTIALHRALGRLAGLQERELRRLVRISYAKVAEIQRRGAIHVVIRLDAATDCRCPVCLAPPPGGFTAALLEDALRLAVRVPCPAPGGRRPGAVCPLGRAARRPQHHPRRRPGGGAVGRAGGYIAKYATKATESFGAGLATASGPTTWSTWTGCRRMWLSSSGLLGAGRPP